MNGMDWNIILFASRWAIIGLFYFVLMVLLIGVYREASQRLKSEKPAPGILYGRLRLLNPGSDPGMKTGTLFDLKTETSLGAEADNDIVLGDQYVSRHHACLRWDGTTWLLEDLKSTNGTLMDKKPCIPNQPQILSKKAQITIGAMEFELVE
jgi:hypothetical protein